MLVASVLFAQPAVAEDAITTETAAAEAADTVDAPAEVETPDTPPAESDPPADTGLPDTSTPADNSTPPADDVDADADVEVAPADDAKKQEKAAEAPSTAMVATHDTVTVAAAAAAAVKVWVCKYVGTPGDDEHLKAGKNPIEVNASAVPPNPVVGTFFNDSQGRSYVLQIGGTDPGVANCPPAVQKTEVTTEAPIVSPPTCTEDGALSLPNTPGVLYTVTPAYAGPDDYDVDATALPNYVLSGASVLHWDVTVLVQLSGQVDCPIIVNPDPKKVWVCKYVGEPGVDEVFKGGKNPIEVSVNSLPGNPVNPQVGDDFSDAQERSHVIALSPADPEPTADDCLPAIVPTEVTAEAPIADPATCEEDGSLVLPQTVGVVYLVLPDFAGPGDYIVTATVLNAAFELVGQAIFPVSVGGKLPAADCILPADSEVDAAEAEATELLPDTGGSSLTLLLVAVSMVAAGFMVLMRRSPVTSVGSAAYSLVLPSKDEMVSAKKAHDSAQPLRIMTTRESIVSKFKRQRS